MGDKDLFKYNLTPELMDEATLLKVLQDRCIKLPNIEALCKDKLVELLQRVVPLPQRTSTRRQQMSRVKKEGSRSLEERWQSMNISVGFNEASSSHAAAVNKASRLKPPPDAINYERKIIKLSSAGASSKPRENNYLDKIVIKDRSKEVKASPTGTRSAEGERTSTDNTICDGIKEVTLRDSGVTSRETASTEAPKPRIKLKRSSISIVEEPDVPASVSECKKQRKKIIF